MNKKLIIKILATSLILASIIGNAYFFGNKWWTTQKNKWFGAGIQAVIDVVVRDGEVKLKTDAGELILIPKQDAD